MQEMQNLSHTNVFHTTNILRAAKNLVLNGNISILFENF